MDEDGNRRLEIEQLLGMVESTTMPILKRLNTSEGPFLITAEEKSILSWFATLQIIRTPAFMNSWRKGYADFLTVITKTHAANKQWFEHTLEGARKAGFVAPGKNLDVDRLREAVLTDTYKIEVEQSPYVVMKALESTRVIYPCVICKELELLKSHSTPFITSDHPVVRVPNPEVPHRYRGGFLMSDLFFPVGSETALYLRAVTNPRPLGDPSESIALPLSNLRPFESKCLNKITLTHAEDYLYSSEKNNAIQELFNKTTRPQRIRVAHPYVRRRKDT